MTGDDGSRRGWIATIAAGGLVAALAAATPSSQAPIFDAGQERQAVFPVYDGFTRNEDGSMTLSFAYFSHNVEPVEVPVGDGNFFGPGAADRGQPTTFHPGHHRWQCVMVVDGAFAGDLRWTVTHAGRTTSTSRSMLQYNWEFAESDRRQALRAIEDPTTVPRDVCLNRPPIVRVLGYGGRRGPHQLEVAVGEELKLFGSVRDEGLPREGTLSAQWRLQRGPGEVRFDAPDQPRTLAVFSEPGEYVVELVGTDSALQTTFEVTVVVEP